MNIELFNQEITTRKINELVYLILITYKNEINSNNKFHVNNKFHYLNYLYNQERNTKRISS